MLWTPVRVQLKQQLANSSESCNDTLFATLVWANLCFRLATSDTIILSKVTKASCASLMHWGRVWETAWFSHNVDVKRRSRPDYTSYMHKQAQLKRKKNVWTAWYGKWTQEEKITNGKRARSASNFFAAYNVRFLKEQYKPFAPLSSVLIHVSQRAESFILVFLRLQPP